MCEESAVTKITLDTGYSKVSIEIDGVLDIDNMFKLIIEPALLASGFSQTVIDRYLDGEAE